MHQTVDALFNLEKSTEVSQLPDPPLDDTPAAVSLRHGGPGIGPELLDPELNPPFPRLHFENHRLHLIAGLDHVARMLHPPAPGHFGDVDQAFDAGLDLDERSVI